MPSKDSAGGEKSRAEATRHRQSAQPVSQEMVGLLPEVEQVVSQGVLSNLSMARPDDILTLQRAVGNHTVHNLLQAKLTVGPVGDHYEREADRVAQQVMSRPIPVGRPRSAAGGQRSIRRQEEEEDQLAQMTPLVPTITPVVQRQEMDEEDEDALQMKSLVQPFDGLRVQRQELDEEELAQMKPLIQRQELDEEELAQMKPGQGDGSFEGIRAKVTRL